MAMVFCVIVVTLVLFQAPVKAQFGIYGGVALPMGDFSSTDAKEGAGRALLGFGAGLEYNVTFSAFPVGWLTSLSATYNNPDIGNAKGVDYTAWIVGWPMTGLRLSIPSFPLFVQLQIGAVVAKAPEYTTKSVGAASYTQSADPAAALGISAGVGGNIGPVYLCARYLSGEPEFDYGKNMKSKQKIDVFLITVGVIL